MPFGVSQPRLKQIKFVYKRVLSILGTYCLFKQRLLQYFVNIVLLKKTVKLFIFTMGKYEIKPRDVLFTFPET